MLIAPVLPACPQATLYTKPCAIASASGSASRGDQERARILENRDAIRSAEKAAAARAAQNPPHLGRNIDVYA